MEKKQTSPRGGTLKYRAKKKKGNTANYTFSLFSNKHI